MSKPENNKSMFLYTALIFIVAILLIIISSFGQSNLQKQLPIIEATQEPNHQGNGIPERAASLSQENSALLQEQSKLKSEINDKDKEIEELNDKLKINDLLLSANGYYSLGNTEKLSEILDSIDADKLTDDQKILYDNLTN